MNLLVDPIFSVRISTISNDVVRQSLPELLSAVMAGEITEFPSIRPHQVELWHVFLVQLILAASRRNNGLPTSIEDWVRVLRELGGDHEYDEPWTLIVADATKPAFMQMPVAQPGEMKDFKRIELAVDKIDTLITAKNHDHKSARMLHASAEEWAYALISLQTSEGFFGAGNYGIARMNGGFASRVIVRAYPSGFNVSQQIVRDVGVLSGKDSIWLRKAREKGVGTSQNPLELLWTVPWSGTASLPLSELHPLGIEACRRIRLFWDDRDEIYAKSAGSKVARIDAKLSNGNVGDPWTPIDISKPDQPKALNVSADGFDYKRCAALLSGERYILSEIQRPTQAELGNHAIFALKLTGLARGQGKTEGFHSREIYFSGNSWKLFLSADEKWNRRLESFTQTVTNISSNALRPAIIQLTQATEAIDWNRPRNAEIVRPWRKMFEKLVDDRIFVVLEASFSRNLSDQEATQTWNTEVRLLVEVVFDRAKAALLERNVQRFMTAARSQGLLQSILWRELGAASDKRD